MLDVLLVDADRSFCAALGEHLKADEFRVYGVHAGTEGIEAALSGRYSLVLLDMALPGAGGFDSLRRIRLAGTKVSSVPILILTRRGREIDGIAGLEAGADDYLPKPFNERELVARMRAILRRVQASQFGPFTQSRDAAESERNDKRLCVDDVELDERTRRVRCCGRDVELSLVEFDLLALLMRNAGKIVSRQSIAAEVLERELLPFDRAIDSHVYHLRHKLGPHPGGGERFKTVRGVGYTYTLAHLE